MDIAMGKPPSNESVKLFLFIQIPRRC